MPLALDTKIGIVGALCAAAVLTAIISIGYLWQTRSNERAASRWLGYSLEVSPNERRDLHVECNTSACQLSWFERDSSWTFRGVPRRVTLMCSRGVCVEKASPCP